MWKKRLVFKFVNQDISWKMYTHTSPGIGTFFLFILVRKREGWIAIEKSEDEPLHQQVVDAYFRDKRIFNFDFHLMPVLIRFPYYNVDGTCFVFWVVRICRNHAGEAFLAFTLAGSRSSSTGGFCVKSENFREEGKMGPLDLSKANQQQMNIKENQFRNFSFFIKLNWIFFVGFLFFFQVVRIVPASARVNRKKFNRVLIANLDDERIQYTRRDL